MNKKRTALSQQQLERLIRTESKESSNLFFTVHVRKQMKDRKITAACVLETLRNGSLRKRPEPNTMKGSLECRMEHFCAGKDIAVVVAICDDEPNLIIVTAMYT